MSRALVTKGQGDLHLVERDPLRVKDGELVVAPLAIGVCGTDLELIDGAIDAAFVRYPLVIGHEWVGLVTASTQDRLAVGDRVVVEGIVPCWHCDNCIAGSTHLCTTGYDEVGFTRDGAAADEIAVPARLAHPVPVSASDEDAALCEPAAVVYHGLSRTLHHIGKRCLVIGDGTIALLAVQLLRLWSPTSIVLLGRRGEQRSLAMACGADAVADVVPDEEFDVVVEAAGSNDAVRVAVAAARRGGTVLLLGLPPHGTTAPLAIDDLVNKDLQLRASFGYSATAFAAVVKLLDGAHFRPGAVVTHRFELSDATEAIDLLRRPRPGEARGKILLFPGGTNGPR